MWSPLDQLTRSGTADVLVVVAHPDDEALLCGATVASLVAGGAKVRVACVGSGPRDRAEVFGKSCAMLGAEAAAPVARVPELGLTLDRALVASVDELVRERIPDVVITHARSGPQHQDHVAVHDAVRLSMARWQGPAAGAGRRTADVDHRVRAERVRRRRSVLRPQARRGRGCIAR